MAIDNVILIYNKVKLSVMSVTKEERPVDRQDRQFFFLCYSFAISFLIVLRSQRVGCEGTCLRVEQLLPCSQHRVERGRVPVWQGCNSHKQFVLDLLQGLRLQRLVHAGTWRVGDDEHLDDRVHG